MQQMIEAICKGKKGVRLTIGTYANGEKQVKVFDETGEIQNAHYTYEIGSITKTFTAALLAKCVHEGKLSLDDSIGKYLGLDSEKYYPTLKRLATHTAGYSMHLPFGILSGIKAYLAVNSGKSPFILSLEKMKKLVQKNKLTDKDYPHEYSNFGFGLLGYAIGVATGKGYWDAMDEFLSKDMGMKNSYTGTQPGKNLRGFNKSGRDVGNWEWNKDLTSPAGDISSTAGDLLDYAKINIDGEKPYLAMCYQKHADIKIKGRVIAGQGLGWVLYPENNFALINHTGQTGAFVTDLCIDRVKKCASVALINYRMPPRDMLLLNRTVLKSLQG